MSRVKISPWFHVLLLSVYVWPVILLCLTHQPIRRIANPAVVEVPVVPKHHKLGAAVGIPTIGEVLSTTSVANALDYGVKGDARNFVDGAITSGTATLTSNTTGGIGGAQFTAADVGKTICVQGAGSAGGLLTTTVKTFTDSQHVVLNANASTTVTVTSGYGAYCAIGTENTSAIQKWLNASVNLRTFTDGAMTSGSATLTSASGAAFTSADVNKFIIVANAGNAAGNTPLYALVLAVNSATSATLSAACQATSGVSSASCTIQNTGGYCFLPEGSYLTTGTILQPYFCTVQGAQRTPRVAFPPQGPLTNIGTSLWVTSGQGSGTGTSFWTIQTNGSLTGVNFFYPCQPQLFNSASAPIAYPWTVLLTGYNTRLQGVGFDNAYQGIYFLTGGRPTIKDIQGQCYSIGLQVDNCPDNARIENVHWIYSYDVTTSFTTPAWTQSNGVGFQFYRCDSLEASKLYCFQYKYGYRFDQTTGPWGGAAWAHFDQCDCDDCSYGVYATYVSTTYGVRFTNSNYTATQTMPVTTTSTNAGPLSFCDCLLVGPNGQFASCNGGTGGSVSLKSCRLQPITGQNLAGTSTGVSLTGGSLLMDACSVYPGASLISGYTGANLNSATSGARASVTNNLLVSNSSANSVSIVNSMSTAAQVANNLMQ